MLQKNKPYHRTSGFTLMELLVVISIIGLLSSLAVIGLNAARIKARDALRKGDMSQLRTALAMYYDDHFSYPICGSVDWDSALPDYGAVAGNVVGEGCDCYIWMTEQLKLGPRPVMTEPPFDPTNETNADCAVNDQHYRYISSPSGQEYSVIYNLELNGQKVLHGW